MTLDEQLIAIHERSQIGILLAWCVSEELLALMKEANLVEIDPDTPNCEGWYLKMPIYTRYYQMKGLQVLLSGKDGQYASHVTLD